MVVVAMGASLLGTPGPPASAGRGAGAGYQPGSPSCWACFFTSWSYSAAPSLALRMPEPTSTVICSSAGPLIGERNSSARPDAPGLSMYVLVSLATWVTSAGSWQVLTAYGPVGVLA